MKKLIICAAALATALFAGSCQRELLDTASRNTVTYSVQLPDVQTKATGDGTNVTQLIYEVWRTENSNDKTLQEKSTEPKTERLYRATATRQGDVFKFDVDLVNNQNYTLLFWAQVPQAEGEEYYNTGNLRSVTLTERALGAFDEDRAAFYGIDFIVANEPRKATQQVTLTRPFGQLNLGTTERNNPNYTLTVENTSVTVIGASTEFNVATGVASSTKTANLTFASDKPFTNEKLNGTYEWISMNYIFVPANQATHEVKYTITTNHGSVTNTVRNVPTKKNYRTNILGNLLTSKTDYIVDINANWTSENTHGTDTEAIQSALDNAMPGSEIHLHPGVNYGTLYIKANPGHSNTTLVDIADAWAYNYVRTIKDVTIKGAEGAKVDGIIFKTGAQPGDQNNTVVVENLTIENVEFTDAFTASNAGYNAPIMITTSNATVDGLTVKGCKLMGDNSKLNLVYLYGADGSKNVTLTGNTVSGIARLCELRGTENVTITNNVINNTYEHAMLLAGGNYAGNVTITGNTADGIRDRFVRMAGAGDATVVIENNTITNYQGKDADYIKVTDGTNVTVENNSISYSKIPAEVNLVNGETVTLPAAEADHTVVVNGVGTLVLNGTTITTTEGPAIQFAEDANVTITVNGEVALTGATDGILVNGATLTVTGTGNLVVEGKAGSGIDGSVTIDDLAHITSKGNGGHAYGIGGNGANVVIKNSTVDYACGGHIQPLFINDTKYGKSEPEGGAAIGGATVKIEDSTITKVDGGSKAAAIGERFWQSTSIEIVNSTIEEANGGNASAGIGGSRYNGDDKYNVSIKIQNSTVTATGGQHGAGIGSGYDTHCNGENYTAINKIEIDATSVIYATGGKYAAGIGTGFHSAYLSGSIAAGATVNAKSGETYYKDTYTTAQNIGYGVVDPAREFSGDNANVTFTVNGTTIPCPSRPYVSDETEMTLAIYSAEGLKYLANEVNKHSNYERPFEGWTITLMNNIDLGGMEWTPIGDYRFSANRFCGTFDGQNHTISNFKITKKTDKNDSNKSSYGFFGNLEGTVKNLTIADATVNSYAYTGALAGRLNNGLIENCHVVDCEVSNTYWQGGILIGQVNAEGDGVTAVVRNCSVASSSITSKSAIGAISGPVTATKGGNITFENCEVENCEIIQQGSFGGNYDKYFGSIFSDLDADETSTIEVKNCTAINTSVKGDNDSPISGAMDGNVYVDGSRAVATGADLAEAVKAGENVILAADIVLSEPIQVTDKTFTINGNGYKIGQSSDYPAEGTAIAALIHPIGGKVVIKNVAFEGIKTDALIRTAGTELLIDNITVKNCNHTKDQGMLRLLGQSTVMNSTFEGNNCKMVISLNFDANGDNTFPQVVKDCVFKENTCNTTAVLYYSEGGSATFDGNKFMKNILNVSNGATLYLGFKKNCTVTNNLFDGNTVTATSKRSSGGLMVGNAAVVTGNAFVNNTVTVNGQTGYGNNVCASPYYAAIDLSGNYWGGDAPVEGDDYYKEYNNYEVIINDFLKVNPFNN